MAYKLQVGQFTTAGAITTGGLLSSNGLNAGDGNITSVGDIAVDSISAAANDMEINMTDNRSTAFVVKESTNIYMRANTANTGGEKVEFLKPIEMSGAVAITFAGADDALGVNAESGALRLSGSAGLELYATDGVSISHLLKMPDNTSGKLLVADGTSFQEVALSGDATIVSSGALTIANNAITNIKMADDSVGAAELIDASVGVAALATAVAGGGLSGGGGSALAVEVSGALKVAGDKVGLSGSIAGTGLTFAGGVNSISSLAINVDGLASLSAAPHATQDTFIVSDNGTEKKVSMTNVANGAFALVSGDATIASGGALTIGTGVVEHAMLAADCIDGDNIQDDVVNSEHIAAGAIDTEHIADSQVTNAKLANASATVGSTSLTLGATVTAFAGS